MYTEDLLDRKISHSLWGKIFKARIAEQLLRRIDSSSLDFYSENRISFGDDMMLLTLLLSYSTRVNCIQDYGYTYHINNKSMTYTKGIIKKGNDLDIICQQLEKFTENELYKGYCSEEQQRLWWLGQKSEL